MNEERFKSMIEDAWKSVAGAADARRKLVRGELSEEEASDLALQSWRDVVPSLQIALEGLSQDELLQFDRTLERKLYDINQDDIPILA